MKYSKKQLNANRKKWFDALLSGEYKQGKSTLASDGKYCCLGVACDVAMNNGIKLKVKANDSVTLYDGCLYFPPDKVNDWLGLKLDGISILADLNDTGRTFRTIVNKYILTPKGWKELFDEDMPTSMVMEK